LSSPGTEPRQVRLEALMFQKEWPGASEYGRLQK